ncbi:hypothetical protein BASA83_006921 [Batrachochytrium salamandrivorans]|nr:hypothetical protein BASA83_006921 [Batrachochytrium salamandrivorans]
MLSGVHPAVTGRPFVVFGKHRFTAEEDDETSFSVGEPIVVTEQDEEYNDGWWKGMNMKGEAGLFPCNFVTFENIANIDVAVLPHVRAAMASLGIDNYAKNSANSTSDKASPPVSSCTAANSPESSSLPPPGSSSDNASETTHPVSLLRGIEGHMEQIQTTEQHQQPLKDTQEPQYREQSAYISSKLATDVPSVHPTVSIHVNADDGSDDGNELIPDTGGMNLPSPNSGSLYTPLHHPKNTHSDHSPLRSNDIINQPSQPYQDQSPSLWSSSDVADWTAANGFNDAASVLFENNIDGPALLVMTLGLLRELGVEPLSDRVVLMHRILFLKDSATYQDNVDRPLADFPAQTLSVTDASKVTDVDREASDTLENSMARFTVSDYFEHESNNIYGIHPLPIPIPTPDSYMRSDASSNSTSDYPDDKLSSNDARLSAVYDVNSLPREQESRVSKFGAVLGKFTSRFSSAHRHPKERPAGTLDGDGHVPQSDQSVSSETSQHNRHIAPFLEMNSVTADYEGWLYVRIFKKRTWHRRYCFLYNGGLYLFKSQQLQQSLMMIPLNADSQILPDIADNSKTPFLFKIKSIARSSSIIDETWTVHFSADSQLAMVGWINVLVRSSNNALRTSLIPLTPIKNTRRSASSQPNLSISIANGIDEASLEGLGLRQTTLASQNQPRFIADRKSSSSGVSTRTNLAAMPPAKFVPDGRVLAIHTHTTGTSPLSQRQPHASLHTPAYHKPNSAPLSPGPATLGFLQPQINPEGHRRISFDDSINVPLQKGIVKRTLAFSGTSRSNSTWKPVTH